jgi:hypothetical protein
MVETRKNRKAARLLDSIAGEFGRDARFIEPAGYPDKVGAR